MTPDGKNPATWRGAGLPGGASVTRRAGKISRSIDLLEVVGRQLAAALVGHEVELDLLTLDQVIEAGALDGADMDEGVLAAVVRLDKAEALGGVEPLHGSRSHG